MNRRELEKRLCRELTDKTPDVWERIQATCADPPEKGRMIVMATAKKHISRKFKALAAGLVAVAAGLTVFALTRGAAVPNATITLDVNPSLEIALDKNETVMAVTPLNEDAKTVVGTMDFKGSTLEVTVNALVGSLLRNGFLTDASNSVLVSVDALNNQQGVQLQKTVQEEISAILENASIKASVLTQAVKADKALESLAETYGISPGKAKLIEGIVAKDSRYQTADLVGLTVNELNLIAQTGDRVPESITVTGEAADTDLIGADKALNIAKQHAGISGQVDNVEWELDYDDGVIAYELEFTAVGFEYEYDIDAKSGAVLESSREEDENAVPEKTGTTGKTTANTTVPTDSSSITAEKAQSIALSHAGVKADAATFVKCKKDTDDGVAVYDVEFRAGGYEYDYEIDAKSGKIRDHDKEWDNEAQPTSGTRHTTAASGSITAEKAKSIALSHAGVKAADATFVQCKKDTDDGVPVYDVEFYAGGYEYEYEIAALTGVIREHDKERDDSPRTTRTTTEASGSITADKATSIALSHAGVKAADAARLTCRKETDDGVAVYDVEFRAGGYEYEYEINAKTGKIREHDKERIGD